jgi:CubicO group peptidase (beta-lactamase class C family)
VGVGYNCKKIVKIKLTIIDMKNWIIIITALFIFTCNSAQINKQDVGISKIDELTAEKIDKLFSKFNNETPGCAVAILQNGEIVFIKSYGMADP